MSSTDRPAAELLSEWKAALRDHKALFVLMNVSAEFGQGALLTRLARAEQALADRDLIARAIFDTKYPHYELLDRDELWAEFGAIGRHGTYYEMADSAVAALRAAQGDRDA
jgi:hypothetical protein